jgi:DNA-binding winged helix-turn-helix (wHTH) protein/tetratricopeptide (TPR) repeat protein
MVTEPRVLYEFGPFRVDPDKQLLLRESRPVVLTPKAFETLLALIRHSREVVTKGELMKAVWPDAFVEEGNLSQNIFVLRKALGDTPEDRRYIVTIPGRGYRFAADVRTVTEESEPLVIASRSRSQVVIEQTESVPSETPPALSQVLHQRAAWKYLLAVGGALGLLILGAGVFFFRHQPALLGERNSVLIADFTNTTGDPVFDDTLRQGLEVQLAQSPFLSLVSQDRVQQTSRLMVEPSDARLTPRLARQVCERIGSAAVLEGSIASLGSQYVLGLRATSCQTGDVLDQEQAQAAKKEEVLSALSQIASRFRIRVGESLATVKRHDTPLARATTPSLDALKAYSESLRVNFRNGGVAAIPFVKRAIEIDPKFAMAYAFLGRLYGDIGESVLSAESVTRAYQLRDRVSDLEKFFITAMYERQVTGNLEKARENCELWAQTYPRDAIPRGLLSGGISVDVGRYENGAEEARKALALDPDFPFGYANLAFNDVSLGRLDQGEGALQRASDRKLDIPDLLAEQYDIAFLEGNRAEMERIAALSKGKPGAEDWIADKEAYVLAYSGHLQEARRMSRRAEDLAQESGHGERSAQYQAAAAVREALFGNTLEARRTAMAAFALPRVATSSMARPLRWLARGILPCLKHSRTTWKSDSPRTRW